MSWASEVFLPLIPAIDLVSDYVVIGTIIYEEGEPIFCCRIARLFWFSWLKIAR